ncbi:MAG TPA: STM4014 family protein [Tepidisphaeraceae bacterium]|jgi:hypothetical protein|nr:STM4014 family protein [Tepidisphaeraceae bacterium]
MQTQSAITPDARFVVIGVPGGKRIELFQAALLRLGREPARVVSWAELSAGRVTLEQVVRPDDIVRIDSPGRDFEVDRLLLAAGADAADEEDGERLRYDHLDRDSAARVAFDKGMILPSRQWFLGFRRVLGELKMQLWRCPRHRMMNDIDDIITMFDKRACHARLDAAGVTVPRALGPVCSFEQLLAGMRETGLRRVFVKIAHGSSASGVVAYQISPAGHQQAITTVEMADSGGGLQLYNSRQIFTYRDSRQIARLIDALARHRVHVEQWLPKAGINGLVFDLRVMVIAAQARQTVVRLSKGPLTNLHLLNQRSGAEAVRLRMGETRWAAAIAECRRAMACFPGSLHGGVDLLIAANFRQHAILEINAFGDLLPGVLCAGEDAYETQIRQMIGMDAGLPTAADSAEERRVGS